MEIVKAARTDEKALLALLKEYFAHEGKDYSKHELQQIITRAQHSGKEFHLLKEGTRVVGCISIILREKNEVELDTLFVAKAFEGKGYEALLLDHALAFCERENIHTIMSVIPRAYELLFAQKGFHLHKNKVCVELKKQVTQQKNLHEQLKDLAHVEETSDQTSEMLGALKTRK